MNIIQHIESDDWARFEAEVLALVEQALTEYSDEHKEVDQERIYQMAIWTDCQWPITAVDFETKYHAKMTFFWNAGVFDLAERVQATEEWEPFDYPVMLSSWKYHKYGSIEHPYMKALKSLDYRDHESRVRADERSETSLLRVRNHVIRGSAFRKSHAGDQVWISVSSPRDWHDHGTLFARRDGTIVRSEDEQVVG